MGDIPTNVYTQQNKKNFLFTMLAETVVMMVFFGYFLCVTATYSEDMHGPEQPEEAAPVEAEQPKEEAPVEEAPKEEAAAGDAEAPAGDAEAPAEDAAAEWDWSDSTFFQVWIKSTHERLADKQSFERWEI